MSQEIAAHTRAKRQPIARVSAHDLPELPHWSPALSVGNAKLDEQHIVLLEMGRNLLDGLVELPAALPRILIELEDLLLASLEHDAAEEHILAANGCPTLSDHRLSHTANRHRLERLLDAARQGDLDVAALRQAIQGWMHHHVNEYDLPVKAYMTPTRGNRRNQELAA